jgi:hypothetical protein
MQQMETNAFICEGCSKKLLLKLFNKIIFNQELDHIGNDQREI